MQGVNLYRVASLALMGAILSHLQSFSSFPQGSSQFKAPESVFLAKGAPMDADGYRTSFGTLSDPEQGVVATGSVGYLHLALNKAPVIVTYTFQSGDRVGLSGAVYEVISSEADALLRRIPDAKVPKGVAIPQVDSFTIPLRRLGPTGSAKLNQVRLDFVTVVVRSIDGAAGKNTKPTALLSVSTGIDTLAYATVAEGDLVLFGDRAYVVRAVVSEDKKSRVAGWVEFAAKPIPEADLIRDKKAYIRPMPKAEKK